MPTSGVSLLASRLVICLEAMNAVPEDDGLKLTVIEPEYREPHPFLRSMAR